MNLIEQFLQQNLTKNLNHQLLSQIQQQNSAVENLVSHLQGQRGKQNLSNIQNKINRIQSFLQLKKQIVTTLQPLNSNTSAIFDWILNSFVNNSFLYQLIKRQEFFVQKQLIQIGKRTLLEDSYLQQHYEDTQFANKIIRELQLLNQQKYQVTKTVNRQKIKQIDYGMQLFQQKMNSFEERVTNFNTQMLLFTRKVYGFDQKIRNDFYNHFKSDLYLTQSPQNNQQNQKNYTGQQSQKSHISLDSQNQQSRSKFVKPKQLLENQRTPRKFLQTEGFQPIQKIKQDTRKSMMEKRRSTLDEKKSLQDARNSYYENKQSINLNKRSSIDIKRPSDKYSQIYFQDELKSMNKTLGSFNIYRPESNSILYTTNQFGRQIRLPTNWASNSRSSISYYPPR